MRPICIYHGGCRDGFAAAWVVWKRFPDMEFVAAQYGQEPPDVSGRDVVIVDFSYPRDILTRMANDCATMLVLDHHKTAEAELKDFVAPNGNVRIVFDMARSGAGLAWDNYFPGEPRPWPVAYVEDRDLWRFALPRSREVNGLLSVIEFTFEEWDRQLTLSPELAADLGRAVEAKVAMHVMTAVEHARRVVIDGHDVPILNVTSDISEVVGKLAETEPFAVGWFQRRDGKFVYSLRSRGDFDVSDIAKARGGGGHKNAAGFILDVLL